MESLYYFIANGGHKWLWTFIGVFTLAALAIWGRGRIKRKAAGYFRLDGKEGLGLLGGSGAGKKD